MSGPFDAWSRGDEQAQYEEGKRAGRQSAADGWVTDCCDVGEDGRGVPSTPYGRGFVDGRREAGGD